VWQEDVITHRCVTAKNAPGRMNGARLGLSYRLPSSFLSGEDRGDRQRRVRVRDEHLDGAAVVLRRATNGASVR
jgi:hypothetical protein